MSRVPIDAAAAPNSIAMICTPEARLVFRTAASKIEPSECLALLNSSRDWKRVIQVAAHEVATLALWRSMQGMHAAFPLEGVEVIRDGALRIDLRMQHLARRAVRTVQALSAAGIPCLLLKGAAVGAVEDPTFRSRPMTDVDILVHAADAERASAVLLGSGWSVTENPVYREMLKDAHHLPHFVDPALPGLRLELHVRLMPDDQPFGFDETLLWSESRHAPASFQGALVPSPEHLALHACVHFAWQHTLAFGAWRTFRVIAIVTKDAAFSWDRFVDTALRVRAGTSCYWSLRLAASLSGISVPAEVLLRLAPPTPPLVMNALERHFIAQLVPGEGPASPSEKLTRLLWRMALRPAWSGHSHSGRHDPEQKWAKAYGTVSTETRAQRILRHARGIRNWTRFFSRTLLR